MSEGWPGVSEPLPNARLRVLSLGAGVQSTTLALMAADGEIKPMPDCAIFADTGWEPEAVYQHLTWLEGVLPFPVLRRHREGPNLGEMMLQVAHGQRSEVGIPALIPYFPGSGGMIPKQCSKEFKTRVIGREICDQLGIAPKQRGPRKPAVELWIGISVDEMSRMKANEKGWIINRWPLIEQHMSRQGCLKWLDDRGYPRPPRSSCIFCPFRSNAEWRAVRANESDWIKATIFDGMVRNAHPAGAYLTKERVPLYRARIDEPDSGQADLFQNECEGMCGV